MLPSGFNKVLSEGCIYLYACYIFVCLFYIFINFARVSNKLFFLYFDTGLLFVEFEVKINVINFGKSCKKCIIRYGTSEAP